jgi:hypothetical protein
VLWVFKAADPAHASPFQTGWFVESLMTQTLIIHVIRTNNIPFVGSRASVPLILTTLAIMAFGAWLPFSPVASIGTCPHGTRWEGPVRGICTQASQAIALPMADLHHWGATAFVTHGALHLRHARSNCVARLPVA